MLSHNEKIGIVGMGYVGKAYGKVFPDAYHYDIAGGWEKKEDINRCGLAIICVPTPTLPTGACDITAVEATVAWLETPLILIKSTVPPGTTAYLSHKYGKRICHSPEYVGEGGYHISDKYLDPQNVLQHPFMIIGGSQLDCQEILDYFVPVFGPEKFYYLVDSTTSELIKYMENSWIAMKVAFCNEFFEIAGQFGVDYNRLREGWLLDPRTERSHTAVFTHNRGFKTKCIPKDVIAIIAAAQSHGYTPKILKQVINSNQQFRQEQDCELINANDIDS